MSDCPSLMLGIAIHCIQHSQAMLERRVCELAHSFFHIDDNSSYFVEKWENIIILKEVSRIFSDQKNS